MLKNLSTLLLAAIVSSGVVSGQGLKDKRVYTVAIDEEYGPYEFVDMAGRVTGFTPDLLRTIGEEAGVAFRFEPMSRPDALKRLRDGRVDLVNMIKTAERLKRYEFSMPHSKVKQAIFRHVSASDINDLASLAGHRIALQRNDVSIEMLADRSDFERRFVLSKAEGFLWLNAGKVDAFLAAERAGFWIIREYDLSNVETAAVGLFPRDFAFAARKGNTALIGMLNESLQRVKATGRYEQLANKWLSAAPRRERWLLRHWKGVAGLMAALAASAMVLVVWSLLLRRTAAKRTEALRESERRYRTLFENSPVSMWEQDLSELKTRLDRLRESGVADFGAFLQEHPGEAARCGAAVRTIDVNKAALLLFNAADKRELLSQLPKLLSEETRLLLFAEANCVGRGQLDCRGVTVARTITGETLHIAWQWAVLPGHEERMSRVLLAMADVTERKQAEDALRQSNEALAMLNAVSNVAVSSHTPEDLAESLALTLRDTMRVDAFILDAYRPGAEVAQGLGNFDTIDGQFRRVAQVQKSFDWRTSPLRKPIFEDKEPVLIHRGPEELDGRDLSLARFGDKRRLSLSLIYVPLVIEGRVIGILSAQSYTANAYSQKDVDLLAAVGRQIAPAVESALLGQQLAQDRAALEHQTKRLTTLREIDQAILEARSPKAIAEAALGRIQELVPYLAAGVLLFDYESNEGEIVAFRTDAAVSLHEGVRFSLEGLEDAVEELRRGEIHKMEDLSTTRWLHPAIQPFVAAGLRSHFEAPLIVGGALIGALGVGMDRTGAPSHEHVEIVAEVAGSLAIAIQQSRLYEQVQRHASELEERVNARTAELNERVVEVERLNNAMINLLEDFQIANRNLEEAARRLRESNTELEAFTHSVSHDLRAPLRAMERFAEVLLEDYGDRLDRTGMGYARRIVGASRRMDRLIKDLLTYSGLSRSEVKLKPVGLKRVAEEALAQVRADVHAKKALVNVEAPSSEVWADLAVLRQVVANLITNAVKFVEPGVQPNVRIWAEDRGERVRLWVEDNGIGVDLEHHERIFDMFQRLHGIETYPGTGVGLAIVQKGTERMGGDVGVESGAGKGSRFWLELRKV